MAVDRGGLHYSIKVENRFSGDLRRFRDEIDQSRKAWKRFKDNLRGLGSTARSVSRNIDTMARAQERLTRADERARRADNLRRGRINREANAVDRLAREGRQLEALRLRQVRAARAETLAVDRLARAYRRLAAAQTTAGITRNRAAAGRTAGIVPVPGGGTPTARNTLTDLSGASRNANREGNRLLFTFRRLFGVLAAFTAARVAAQGIADLVRRMVEFNKIVESARLGIASLITASSDVRDAVGGTVDAQERLILAQKEARRQTALLRKDGLATAATYEQLVDTFQIAIGPGLAANLDLDQIRKFTVQVSQAAAAAGVAQNQLSEEIRSILSGTIQQRTTRLAAVLGITNEDVRKAKEAGRLFEFLQEKFGAFTLAGEEALGTFTAIVSNAQDALSQILGAGGLEFFEELKSLLQDFQGALVATDVDGLAPSPQAVQFVQSLAEGLEGAVAEGRRLIEALSFEDVNSQAALVGRTVSGLAQILGRVLEGITRGVEDLASVVNGIGETFDVLSKVLASLTGLDVSFGGILSTIVRIAVVVGGIVLGVKTFVAFADLLFVGLTAVGKTVGVIAAAFGGISLSALGTVAAVVAVGAALAAVAETFRQVVADSTGIELSWISIAKIVKNEFVGAITLAAIEVRRAIGGLEYAFERIKIGFAALAGESQDEIVRRLQAADDELASLNRILDAKRAIALEDRSRANTEVFLTNDKNTVANTAKEIAQGAADAAKDALAKLGIELFPEDSLEQQKVDFRDLNNLVSSLSPTIARVRDGIEQQAKLSERLTESAREGALALRQQSAALGTTGVIEQQLGASVKARATLLKQSASLVQEEAAARLKLRQVAFEQREAEERIASLQGDSRARFDAGLAAVREQLRLRSALAQVEQEQAARREQVDRLLVDNQEKEARRLQRVIAAVQNKVASLSVRLRQSKDLLSTLFADLSSGQAETFSRLIESSLTAAGKEKVAQEELAAVLRDVNELRRASNDNLARELTLKARGAAQRLAPDIAEANIRLAGERGELAAEQSIAQGQRPVTSAASASASAQLALIKEQLSVARQKAALEQQQLSTLLQEQVARRDSLVLQQQSAATVQERGLLQQSIATSEEAISALREQQVRNGQKNATELLRQEVALDRTRIKLQQINDLSGKNGFVAGFVALARRDLATLPQEFQTAFDTIQEIGQRFASLVADLITSAFDPNSDASLKERFSSFLEGIANLVLQKLVADLVAQAIATVVSAASQAVLLASQTTSAAGAVSGVGLFAEGGIVPNRPTHPGGIAGSRSDTVLAGLTPGEFVNTTRTTGRLGADFFQALDRGMGDPSELRAVAGLKRRRRVRGHSGPFASGGSVAAPSPGGGGAGPVYPAVVVNEETMQRMLASGSGAMLDWVEQNKSLINGALRSGGS